VNVLVIGLAQCTIEGRFSAH